jgi:hypothetical protein
VVREVTDMEADRVAEAARRAERLSTYEGWMVRSNLARAEREGVESVVATLRANGYFRVADAVEKEASG